MKLWHWGIVNLALIAVILFGVSYPGAPGVKASNNYISIGINTNIKAGYLQTDLSSSQKPGYYYLTDWIGDGSEETPYIPYTTTYTPADFSALDLREKGTGPGYCIVFTTEFIRNDSRALLLTDYYDKTLTPESVSAISLSTGKPIIQTSFDKVVYDLMADKLRPGIDGQERIFIGNQIYGLPKPKYSHTTITESFTGTGEPLGYDLTWTELAGDTERLNDKAITKLGWPQSWARADSDLGSPNMYAQAELYDLIGTNDVQAGVLVRKDSSSTKTFYDAHYYKWTKNFVETQKVISGSITILGHPAATYVDGAIIKLESDGTTITTWYDSVQISQYTDTSISTGNYAGIMFYSNVGTQKIDNFEASALVVSEPGVSSTPSSKAFGVLVHSQTYWSYDSSLGYSPSWPLDTAECYAYLENTGTATGSVTANATNFTGGTPLTLTDGSPGSTSVRMSIFKAGDGSTDNVTLTTADRTFLASMASGNITYWEIKLEWNTSFEIDANQKTSVITFTISAI